MPGSPLLIAARFLSIPSRTVYLFIGLAVAELVSNRRYSGFDFLSGLRG